MIPPPSTTTMRETRRAAAANLIGSVADASRSLGRGRFIRETSARYWLERAKTADIGPVSRCARTFRDRRLRGPVHRWGSLILLAALTGTGDAVSNEESSVDSRDDLVHVFGFEERTTTDWSHAFEQASGLPRQGLFFDVATDEQTKRSGRASLRFDLEGGSISYRTRRETSISISSDSDYRVTGWIRSEGLERSIARLEVRLVDGYQLELSTAEGISEDPVADATRAVLIEEPQHFEHEWGSVRIDIDTERLGVADIRRPLLFLALQVVQPGFDAQGSLIEDSVPRVEVQDVGGRAWFDSIAVTRVPSVHLQSLTPGGLVDLGSMMPFRVELDDPSLDGRRARLDVRDLDGTLIERIPLDFGDQRRMEIELRPPGLGWFTVDLIPEEEFAGRPPRATMLVVPAGRLGRARIEPRLGMSITDWTPETLDDISAMLEVLSPAVVEFPVWPTSMDDRPSLVGLEPLRSVLDRQRFASREVMVAFDRLHGGLAAAARVEPSSLLAAVGQDSDGVLTRAMEDWMQKLGAGISRWRFSGDWASGGIPGSVRDLAKVHIADPKLLVSRSLGSASLWDDEEICLEVESEMTAAAMKDGITEGVDGWSVRISPPPAGWMQRDRVAAASRRLLEAWLGGAERILFPWDPGVDPDPTIMAWTGLAAAIDGRRPEGMIPVGTTSRCLVAADEQEMVLVVQSDLYSGEDEVTVPIGDGTVEIVDLDGRRRIASSVDGLLTIPVGSLPRMIHGADRVAVGIAASARVEPGELLLDRREHQIEIRFQNPGYETLSGMLHLEPPSGWSFEPATPRFRIDPGDTVGIPVTVRWSGSQRLGRNAIHGRVEIEGGGSPIPIEVPLELTSRSLRVSADWSVARGGDPRTAPIIVSLSIENIGERSLDLEVDASAWKVGRERRLVTGLRPGEQEVRRFRMKAGLDKLERTDIRIELREMDGEEGMVLDLPIGGGMPPGDQEVPRTQTAVVRP